MPQLSIIIPTYNRNLILQKSLRAANEAINGLDAEIIVVNDSKTETPVIPGSFQNTRLINNSLQGPASARNLGASVANAPNLLFIDDDFIITRRSLEQVLDLLDQYPKDCFNFPYKYPAELYEKITKKQFGRYLIRKGFTATPIPSENLPSNGLFENPECLGSGFLAIRKSLFQEAGGYDEKCVFAGEDAALMDNLQAMGSRVYINSRCVVYHNEEDRTDLRNWLQRQYRGIKTTLQAQSQQNGIKLKWPYSGLKESILRIFAVIYPVFFFILLLIPNHRYLDGVYFKVVDLLYVVHLYRGYRDGFAAFGKQHQQSK